LAGTISAKFVNLDKGAKVFMLNFKIVTSAHTVVVDVANEGENGWKASQSRNTRGRQQPNFPERSVSRDCMFKDILNMASAILRD
jgi:hypothetical protein